MVALRRTRGANGFALLAAAASLTICFCALSSGLFAQAPSIDSLSPLPPYSVPPLANSPQYSRPTNGQPAGPDPTLSGRYMPSASPASQIAPTSYRAEYSGADVRSGKFAISLRHANLGRNDC